ncbi:RsmB/NOP family class I SAM-dependent RNA methyltransferase [Estrella lausannensis]|uniref:Putative ribosomal RNA small subunit methyltransferase B n=1 Tax=Estrella lausannensis TaxID=483423 RepID=A0A0H5DNE9_9BACT|nr:RsmB/NOP family class I SAM-dependent RNA methyltransferase [Estrella lausannensis]CRX37836.1 putative ribosomal RNA small subunit methyltransferase B [Estrella lausannensis]
MKRRLPHRHHHKKRAERPPQNSFYHESTDDEIIEEETPGLNPFRMQHMQHILSTYELKGIPMDKVLRDHFKMNKSVGSKDRAFIANTVYSLIRHLSLIDYLLDETPSWVDRLRLFFREDLGALKSDQDIPLHVRACMPEFFFDLLKKQYGEEKAFSIASVLNEEAPTTIRANPLRIEREGLLKKIQEHVHAEPTSKSPLGIVLAKRIDLFSLPEFKAGLFEVQDEASQIAAELVRAKEGDSVLDYCAGSGGKTLLIAARMQNKGQVYLHDVRPSALSEAKLRLRRAGVQNAQIIQAEDPKLSKLKKKMDWVLVDAPCSGTGTLRRNPDMKWKIDQALIDRLRGEQRTIFESALSFVKEGGYIVYATCSILDQENEKQVEHFLAKYPVKLAESFFISLPESGGMDGFFAAVFKRTGPATKS